MKKHIGAISMLAIAAIVLTMALALTGCGAADGAPAGAQSPAITAERVVIYGEIKETIGNMITIDLIDRQTPQSEMTDEEREAMRERMEQSFGQDGETTLWSGERPDPGSGELPEGFAERFAEGIPEDFAERFAEGMPEGFAERFAEGMPEDFAERFAEGFPEGFPEGAIEIMPGGTFNRGRNYTGESREIIIPAGAPITESKINAGEQSESEISLDKLKVGDIIEVTYASDGETVAKVVKQSSQQPTRRTTDGTGFTPGGGPEFFITGGDNESRP